jgi:CBS domain-containing protein
VTANRVVALTAHNEGKLVGVATRRTVHRVIAGGRDGEPDVNVARDPLTDVAD